MTLQELYESLTLSKIEDFVSSGKEESLTLEFKTIKSASLKSKDDKRNLARALSGFANSSGGLVIWGVNAKINADGIDCACELKPIDNLPLFLSKLNELTGEGTSPILSKVQHKIIKSDGKNGYAVTLVLESESGPHMAKLGENRYVKRSGDSFYTMEHFDIADMFGRRKRPILDIEVEIRENFGFGIWLTNKGRGSAIAPYIAICDARRFRPYYTAKGFSLTSNHHNWLEYGSSTQVVIHPNSKLHVVSFHDIEKGQHIKKQAIAVEYKLTALDHQMIQSKKPLSF